MVPVGLPIIYIALGGALGAITRALAYWLVARLNLLSELPVATLCVNVLGSFFIGVLSMYLLQLKSENMVRFVSFCLITGYMGSLTTFSTFALDTVNLLNTKALAMAMFNIIANCSLCIFAVILGKAAYRLIYG